MVGRASGPHDWTAGGARGTAMPRKPIGETAMTDAERQARCRAARIAGKPAIRIAARPTIQPSPALADAVAELTDLQAQYATWLDALPSNLRESTTADALQAICDVDLTDLQAIEPPCGFGRD